MTTNHEKYLAGEPLTEELKALKEGRQTEPGPSFAAAQAAVLVNVRLPLNRAERAALREMRSGPGWPVLQKLLERTTLHHTEAATNLSMADPLANREAIALAWAYLNLFKRTHQEINTLVETELEKADDVKPVTE